MVDCKGCKYLLPGDMFTTCLVYMHPDKQHSRMGGCAMKPRIKEAKDDFKLNPLKASRRSQEARK
jgi:hypothetical protein